MNRSLTSSVNIYGECTLQVSLLSLWKAETDLRSMQKWQASILMEG